MSTSGLTINTDLQPYEIKQEYITPTTPNSTNIEAITQLAGFYNLPQSILPTLPPPSLFIQQPLTPIQEIDQFGIYIYIELASPPNNQLVEQLGKKTRSTTWSLTDLPTRLQACRIKSVTVSIYKKDTELCSFNLITGDWIKEVLSLTIYTTTETEGYRYSSDYLIEDNEDWIAISTTSTAIGEEVYFQNFRVKGQQEFIQDLCIFTTDY